MTRTPREQKNKTKLHTVPITLREANELVKQLHRHSQPVVGHRFSIGAAAENKIVGVAIVGNPVARHLNDGYTAEVTRCVTDGTPNACSYLYAAAWRACRAMGFRRLVTYTLKSESGASLRASGWTLIASVPAKSWNTPSRPRVDKHELQERLRWELTTVAPADQQTASS